MEIREAIEHAQQVSEGCPAEGRDCAYQHDKLADWLTELQAYRATGLTPEEVLTGKELAEIACAMNLLKEYQGFGTIEHFRELVQAEQDGRLVVLPPVKIGDTAFFVINNHIFGGTVYFMSWECHKSFGVRGHIYADCAVGTVSASLSDFGKTVFLARKEAEVALRKGKKQP